MTGLHRGGPTDGRASSKHLDGCGTNGTEPSAATPGPGVDELLPRLDGVERVSRVSWKALCPLHDDTKPSLTFNVKKRPDNGSGRRLGLFGRCIDPGCAASLPEVIRHLGLPLGRVLYDGYEAYRQQAPKYVETLSEAYVEATVVYLHANPDLLAYVTEIRGVNLVVARRQRLGFDEGRERWTIPVFTGRGRLLDVRRYDPNAPKGVGKMRSVPGAKGSLFVPTPRRRRLAETVFVCEGEWDALAAVSGGLRAATGTLGAGTWLAGWSRWLAGLDVVFVYDCDDAGRDGAAKAAAQVAAHARSVRVLDLDPGRDDSWDVSDWFAAGRSARDLIALAASVSPLGEEGGGPRGLPLA